MCYYYCVPLAVLYFIIKTTVAAAGKKFLRENSWLSRGEREREAAEWNLNEKSCTASDKPTAVAIFRAARITHQNILSPTSVVFAAQPPHKLFHLARARAYLNTRSIPVVRSVCTVINEKKTHTHTKVASFAFALARPKHDSRYYFSVRGEGNKK